MSERTATGVRTRSRSQSQRRNDSHVDAVINQVATDSAAAGGGSQTSSVQGNNGSQASNLNLEQLEAIISITTRQVTASVMESLGALGIGGRAAPSRPQPPPGPRSSSSQVSGLGVANPEPRFMANKPQIARFNGKDTAMQVDSWLRLFEVAFVGATEQEKVQLLIRHLDGEAITWFSEDVAETLDSLTWADIKQLMSQRFGEKLVRPIVAAQSRFMNRTDTIQSYYEDKMRLLRRIPGLTPIDQAAMLTAGMPFVYKTSLMSARITSPADWLELSLQLETVYKYKKPPPRGPDGQAVETHGSRPANREPAMAYQASGAKIQDKKKKPDKRPSKPCRFCLEANVTAYHWHSECDRRSTVHQAAEAEAADADVAFTASGNANGGRAH